MRLRKNKILSSTDVISRLKMRPETCASARATYNQAQAMCVNISGRRSPASGPANCQVKPPSTSFYFFSPLLSHSCGGSQMVLNLRHRRLAVANCKMCFSFQDFLKLCTNTTARLFQVYYSSFKVKYIRNKYIILQKQISDRQGQISNYCEAIVASRFRTIATVIIAFQNEFELRGTLNLIKKQTIASSL